MALHSNRFALEIVDLKLTPHQPRLPDWESLYQFAVSAFQLDHAKSWGPKSHLISLPSQWSVTLYSLDMGDGFRVTSQFEVLFYHTSASLITKLPSFNPYSLQDIKTEKPGALRCTGKLLCYSVES